MNGHPTEPTDIPSDALALRAWADDRDREAKRAKQPPPTPEIVWINGKAQEMDHGPELR